MSAQQDMLRAWVGVKEIENQFVNVRSEVEAPYSINKVSADDGNGCGFLVFSTGTLVASECSDNYRYICEKEM